MFHLKAGTYLPTPFTRSRVTLEQLPVRLPDPTYEEYQLFCLRTRLLPLIYPLDITFSYLQGDTVDTMQVVFSQGGEDYQLSPERILKYSKYIDTIIRSNPGYCLLRLPVPAGVSKSWWESKVYKLSLDDKYSPIWTDEGWLITLDKLEYADIYHDLMLECINKISDEWSTKINNWTEYDTSSKWMRADERITYEIAKNTNVVKVGNYINIPADYEVKVGELKGIAVGSRTPMSEKIDGVTYQEIDRGQSYKVLVEVFEPKDVECDVCEPEIFE